MAYAGNHALLSLAGTTLADYQSVRHVTELAAPAEVGAVRTSDLQDPTRGEPLEELGPERRANLEGLGVVALPKSLDALCRFHPFPLGSRRGRED